MHTDATILTPSQRWQTMETTFNVFSSSASTARLDVVGGAHSATWLLPLNGGSPIGTGDSSLVELHPTAALTSVETGNSITMNITFRIEPSWDDSDLIQVSSRLLLSNGVFSIPALYTWGGMGAQGYENDLEIKQLKKDIKKHCKQNLDRFKVPAEIIINDKIIYSSRFKKSLD